MPYMADENLTRITKVRKTYAKPLWNKGFAVFLFDSLRLQSMQTLLKSVLLALTKWFRSELLDFDLFTTVWRQCRNFFIPYLCQLFSRHDVGQAL